MVQRLTKQTGLLLPKRIGLTTLRNHFLYGRFWRYTSLILSSFKLMIKLIVIKGSLRIKLIVRPERVSPWEIETFVAPIPTALAPPVAVLMTKRPRPPIEILNHGSLVSAVWNSSHDSAEGPRGDNGYLLRTQMEAGWLSSSPVKASRNETEYRLGVAVSQETKMGGSVRDVLDDIKELRQGGGWFSRRVVSS
ncbi:Aux/IAA-ARF-dimerization [Artemisia annua]|uniref:Aux/IAA-ARF-dimerization n=1 Tax=Artemisia annua TaxID=35608 RepID=A0A2U1LJ07_ARTAN|nr:Aux/IAA-ARF-dimerization [Artemisia annua]